MKYIKKLLYSMILSTIMILSLCIGVHAAPIDNAEISLTQPDGTQLSCYASGDEYFNYLHDSNGNIIIQHPDTGYYVYAKIDASGKLIESERVAVNNDYFYDDNISSDLVPIGSNGVALEDIDFSINANLVWSAEEETTLPEAVQDNELQAVGVINSKPLKGKMENIVVMICFSDESPEIGTDIKNRIENVFNAPNASLKEYMKMVSQGVLEVNSTLVGMDGNTVLMYQDTHPRSYYRAYNSTTNPDGYQGGDNGSERTQREHELLKNVVNAINGSSLLEGKNLDIDGDGYVDSISFFVSGNVNGWNSLLWPHKWSLYSYNVKLNGKRVYKYSLQLVDRTFPKNSTSDLSVICHETLHVFGLPDLYRYSGGGNSVGYWDIMASNDKAYPQIPNSHSLLKYAGWGNSIVEVTGNGRYTLSPIGNLDLIKTYLANGYVLNIVTYEDSWKRKKISVESESGEEQTEEKNICISVNGNEGLHAMTVVGYDDEFYYDINGNGVQEDGEFGAFKLINSRGAEDHYENWFMYDALNAVSSVSPYNQRQQGWAYNEFTWVTMYENYSPKLLTEFDITTNNRGAVDLSLGYGGNLSSEPDEQWKPFIFNETKYNSELGNNSFNLSGTKDEEIASIVLDYTDLINEKEADKIDEELKWYVSSNANISNFKIKEVGFDEEYESTEELPNVAGLISCQCRLPLKVARDKVWKISANYPLNQESIKSSTVYVKDINDNEFYTRAALDGDKNITVTPRTKYKENGYYYLVVEGLKTVGGNGMQIQPIKKHFFVAPDDEEEVDYSIESSFMDNKFLNIIRKLVKKPQGVVYLSDVKDIKELDVSNSDITNLEGIEYFKSLEKLNCSNNKITQLDLSRNINLTTLDVSNNKLTELDLSHNTLLTDVNVNGNDLNPALVGFKINNGYDSSSDDYNDYINDMNEYGSVIDLLEKDSLPKINFVGKKLFAYVKLENSIFVDKLILKMSTNDENTEIKNENIVLTHIGDGIFTGVSSGAYGDEGLATSLYDGKCELVYTKKHDDLHKEISLGAYKVEMKPGY